MRKQGEVRSCMKAMPAARVNGGTVNGRGQWAIGRQCGQATHLCGSFPLLLKPLTPSLASLSCHVASLPHLPAPSCSSRYVLASIGGGCLRGGRSYHRSADTRWCYAVATTNEGGGWWWLRNNQCDV